MFILLRNNRGQGIVVQYVLTFFLVIGVAAAMSVFVRRGIQGRIRDARVYMVNTIRQEGYNGDLYLSYEPYYADTAADRGLVSNETRQGVGVGSSGEIFQLDVDQETTIQSTSQQLPAANAL